MRDSAKLVSPEAAFALAEEYSALFRQAVATPAARSEDRCEVEFVL